MRMIIAQSSSKINGSLCSAPAPLECGLHPLLGSTGAAIVYDLLFSEGGGNGNTEEWNEVLSV